MSLYDDKEILLQTFLCILPIDQCISLTGTQLWADQYNGNQQEYELWGSCRCNPGNHMCTQ